MMTTFSDRLKNARETAGLSQGELARRVKVSRAAVSQWENGTTQRLEGQNLLATSKVLNVTPEWLSRGIGQREQQSGANGSQVSYSYNNDKSIPIIDWSQATHWKDKTNTEGITNWILADGDFSNQSFALIIDNDVLTQDTFPKGTKIIVDPNYPAKSGNIVIAKLLSSDKPTLKRLVIDGETRYLQPLNSLFKPTEIDDKCIICGVVRRAITDYDAI